MKVFMLSLILISANFLYGKGFSVKFFTSYFLFLPLQGYFLVRRKNKTTPKAKESVFKEYIFFYKVSGGM